MKLTQLSLSTLKDLDGGKATLAVDLALRQVALDLSDRPGDPSGRKVKIEFVISPVTDETGVCGSAEVSISVDPVLPKRKTRKYSMALAHNGTFHFNPDSADNVHQTTLINDEDD